MSGAFHQDGNNWIFYYVFRADIVYITSRNYFCFQCLPFFPYSFVFLLLFSVCIFRLFAIFVSGRCCCCCCYHIIIVVHTSHESIPTIIIIIYRIFSAQSVEHARETSKWCVVLLVFFVFISCSFSLVPEYSPSLSIVYCVRAHSVWL